MKNLFLLAVLFILSSCYKKQVYEQYKKEKHGTVQYQPPKNNYRNTSTVSRVPLVIPDDEEVPLSDPAIVDTLFHLSEINSFTTYIGNLDYSASDSMSISKGKIYTTFQNCSFEQNKAAHSTNPRHWENCSNKTIASPVDIHTFVGAFQVKHAPYDGFRYVGMVVRDDETYESIGQYLDKPLLAGKKYALSFYTSRANDYISLSKSTLKEENFNEPSIVRVWLGKGCYKAEIIGETNPISSTEWIHYTLIFEPEMDSDYLIFEAYYDEGRLHPYNGNILLDNISPIVELPFQN